MQTLIALQNERRCFLFKTKADQVVLGGRECIGGGDSSVLRYIADMASRTHMQLEQALPFAIYLVTLANRYVDGCGFGVDAVILREGQDEITFLDKQQTAKYSKRFAQFEQQMVEEFFKEN